MIRPSTLSHDRSHPYSCVRPRSTIGPMLAEAMIPAEGRPHRAVLTMKPPANDPVVSIEEAIRDYVDSQPSQLYRGGA